MAVEMFGAPDPGVFFKDTLLLFTAVGGMFAAYLAVVYDIPWFLKDIKNKNARWPDRLLFMWWAMTLLGVTATSFVIGKVLLHVPRIDYNLDLMLYGAGATMISVGLIGVAIGYARGGRRRGPLGDGRH